MEQGYAKGDSSNLPFVDGIMVALYFNSCDKFLGAEMKGVKSKRAGRESYGDDAIGYVQVKRDGDICTLKGRITPEHKVRSKCYSIVMKVNETEKRICSVDCQDCAASAGGCKHAIAFLMWVHRRSEEPAPTSVECYWKKSKLSSVGTTLKFVKSCDMLSPKPLTNPRKTELPGSFLHEVLDHGQNCDSSGNTMPTLLNYYKGVQPFENLSIHNLAYWFIESKQREFPLEDFFQFCEKHMTPDLCQEAEKATHLQCGTSLWHRLRFGRITASKIYEASRCKTLDGSLVESILGAKVMDTPMMKRGRDLEPQVLKVVEQKTGQVFQKVGLVLNGKSPFIGASPDAISTDCVIEVKCPSTTLAVSRYVSSDETLSHKCNSQIQLQMHMTGKTEGLFCVAHPDFETSKKVNIYNVTYDREYIQNVIDQALLFWQSAIFPKLMAKHM